jgi:glycosyltransferase involved in cell wall biosynthesis
LDTMAEHPLVSAVIPTRNRPDLVCRAARSALDQTYHNLEVVVVIDGPDPTTVQALEQLNERRLRIIELQEHVGGSEARNLGIREARGELIALLDDDDEWMREKISEQYAAYVAHGSRNSIVVCNYLRRRATDTLVCVRPPHTNENISEYMFHSDCIFRSSLRHLPVIDCYFAHKDTFVKTPFRPNLPVHQDWDWLLRAMSHHDRAMVLVNKPLALVNCTIGTQRVSMTTQWTLSLQWADASIDLFTARSYSGFITEVCMRRAEDLFHRIQIFYYLLTRCIRHGHLTLPQIISATKWFFLPPCIRRSHVAHRVGRAMYMQYLRITRAREKDTAIPDTVA